MVIQRYRCMVRRYVIAAALTLFAMPTIARADCTGLLPPARVGHTTRAHSVTSKDLLALRDIGQPDTMFGEPSPLALSPDRRSVAFVLNRADAMSNGYCRALIVVDIADRRGVRSVDEGGALITESAPYRGYVVKGGFPALIIPAWSPDGKWIAYLRKDNGVTQVWRAAADGSGARPVSHSKVDVDAWVWSHDGQRIIYSARPGELEASRRVELQGQSGWLYDASISPDYGPRPQMPATIPREIVSVDLATDKEGPADAKDAALLDPAYDGTPLVPAATADGVRAVVRARGTSPFSPTDLVVDRPGAREIRCSAEPCARGIQNLWWGPGASRLLILRREGWRDERMALYDWVPGTIAPRRLFSTANTLFACQMVAGGLLCLSENASHPRRLVMINPRNGTTRTLFDPNPEVEGWRLGSVQRLRWTNDQGLEAWGDLVLPPDRKPGTQVPLVVVQYHSNGFLRGGTGDEYPIYALAARGIAVLSLERPMPFGATDPRFHSWDEIIVAGQKDWAERRSLLSSITRGVELAISTGVIDPARLGITGLSDGASSTRFALLNSSLFKAAAISSCCLDPKTVMTYGGIAWADYNLSLGYPPATRDDPAYWKPYSLAQGAMRMKTPLLMQLADSELLLSLEAFEALREYHRPVEMFVFPDEYHIKWQPLHRLAIYDRNIDWFDFWLRNRMDPVPGKKMQYERWEKLRGLAEKPVSRGG